MQDTGYYLALTFGTLLSSQGADAHDPRPIPWPSFAAVSPLYTGLRSSLTTRARPAVSQTLPGPVRSRSVHEEPYTHFPGPARGGRSRVRRRQATVGPGRQSGRTGPGDQGGPHMASPIPRAHRVAGAL